MAGRWSPLSGELIIGCRLFHRGNLFCRNFWLVVLLACLLQQTGTEASFSTGTETLIGIVGRDFILLGADSSIGQSIALTATGVDKISVLVDPFPQQQQQEEENGKKRTMQQSSSEKHDFVAKGEGLEQSHHHQQQQTIAIAIAGNPADADMLVQLLRGYGALEEYENGIGCDVEMIQDGGSVSKTNDQPSGLSVAAMAHLARHEIYQRLRTSRSAFKVGALLAGMMSTAEDFQEEEEEVDSFSERVRRQLKLATGSLTQSPTDFSEQTLIDDETSSQKPVENPPQSLGRDHFPTKRFSPHLYWLDEYGSLQRLMEYGVHGYASAFLWSILDRGYQPNMTLEQAHSLMLSCFHQLKQRYLFNQGSTTTSPPCIKCIDVNGCRRMPSK